jgi:hypothetical protein
MTKEYYILYILNIPRLRAIKIGITSFDRFNNRLKEIESAFGKINKSNSYIVTSKSMKNIKNLEKSLHLISWKFKKNIKNNIKSGHTEFFNQNILKSILLLIKTINKTMNNELSNPQLIIKKSYFKYYILLFFSIFSIFIYFYKNNLLSYFFN